MKETPPDPATANPATKPKARLHGDIFKLGWVSFLTDLSSEMIFSVFAIFFTTVAGASTALLGLIEGLADLSASSLNYLAGWLSDRGGKRKVFVMAGYGFSTLAKAILLISSSVLGLSLFRVLERLGKGFRGPPRQNAAMPLVCTRPWTRLVQCWGRWWPMPCCRGWASRRRPTARCFGWPVFRRC